MPMPYGRLLATTTIGYMLKKDPEILIKDNEKQQENMQNQLLRAGGYNALKEALANNGVVSTCENCETFGICPHSYREYDYKYECDKLKQEMNKVTIQQKEFIKYLEGEIKTTQIKWGDKLTENGYIDIAMTVRAYQIILQKYTEIIGSNSNVKK